MIKFEAERAEQDMNDELNRDCMEMTELTNKLSKMTK